jgi:hypothetical protein
MCAFVGARLRQWPFLFSTGVLAGCVQSAVAIQDFELPTAPMPFFASAEIDDALLFTGYDYEKRVIAAFAVNAEATGITAHAEFSMDPFDTICEGPNAVLLSSESASRQVTLYGDQITLEGAGWSCAPETRPGVPCAGGSSLFLERLPGRLETLSICYDPRSRETTFRIIDEAGSMTLLGAAGTSPGGPGRYVVTRGVTSETFLAHHTRSAIPESAVLVDLSAQTIAAYPVPDLEDARPSRGLGAGQFGVRLHPTAAGLLVEGEGGDVFLVDDDRTTRVAENVRLGSVRVTNEGCSGLLVRQDGEQAVLSRFEICSE